MPETVAFHARSLTEKFGFDKGRMLDGILNADGYPADEEVVVRHPVGGLVRMPLSHAVLKACVERFLVPLLKGVKVKGGFSRRENPVRIDGLFYGDQAKRVDALLKSTVADVPKADVLTVAAEVASQHGIPRKAAAET